jgi:hypothetical protein
MVEKIQTHAAMVIRAPEFAVRKKRIAIDNQCDASVFNRFDLTLY